MTALTSRLEALFALRARKTDVRTEVLAGATTFVTMAYILFVNPGILGAARPDSAGAILTSTALVAAVMTIAMGLFSNLPLALAPGMGLNAVVAFQLVLGPRGLTFEEAMGVIVAEGAIITLLVLTGVRQSIIRAVPMSQKKAVGIGIGLFLAIVGLVNAGIVSRSPADPVPVALGKAGHLPPLPTIVFLISLVAGAILLARGLHGALLIGMAIATVVAIATGVSHLPATAVSSPHFDLLGAVSFGFVEKIGLAASALIVFSIMLSDFFDTMGTVVAVGEQAGYLDEKGEFPRPRAVLLVDSLAAVAGGAAGTSSATTYVESAAGVAAGGRTGLTSVVCGLLFAVCIFLAPLAGLVPPQATGAVLVLVGFLMMREVVGLPWNDFTEAVPAFLTMVMMPFTYSITNGVGAGFISYVVLKVCTGRAREVHPLLAGAAVAFVAYFALGGA
jgi:AGZA family xanthine/uracil permease-like MFS transporter